MKSVSYYFPKLYADQSEIEELKIKDQLKRLYDEYATRYASSNHVYSGSIPTSDVNIAKSVSASGISFSSQSSFAAKRNSFTAYLEESSQNAVVLTDLEQYLKDDALPMSQGSGNSSDDSFDVLGWWKAYERRYPICCIDGA